MASYQDIETRLRVVEDKINFVMRSTIISRKVGIVDPHIERVSLLDIYRELTSLPRRESAVVSAAISESLMEPKAPEETENG